MLRQDGGCPIGRHELLNEEWELITTLRDEVVRWHKDNAPKEKDAND